MIAAYLVYAAAGVSSTTPFEPVNKTVSTTGNITFNCTATANATGFIHNITLFIWNESETPVLYNVTSNTTNGSVGGTVTAIWEASAVPDMHEEVDGQFGAGANYSYTWGCYALSNESATGDWSANRSFQVDWDPVNLIYPPNKTWFTTDSISVFACNATTYLTSTLINTTLYVWNNSADYDVFNVSSNTTNGTDDTAETLLRNYTVYNFSEKRGLNYTWTCLAEDNHSANRSIDHLNMTWGYQNYTFGVDLTNPNVSIWAPNNGSSYSGPVNFIFNVSDLNNVSNCSLYIDGTEQVFKGNSTKGFNITVSAEPAQSSLNSWHIGCYDESGRQGNSTTWTLYYAQSSGGSDNGGSSGTNHDVEISTSGITKTMQRRDSLTFDSNGDSHKLTIDTIYTDSVKVKIESNPVYVILDDGETINYDLDGDANHDITVTSNRISSSKVSITLKKYVEPSGTDTTEETEEDEITGEVISDSPEEDAEEGETTSYTFVWWIIGAIVILAIVYTLRKKKRR